jgi:large subunit ribosomal protein L21e
VDVVANGAVQQGMVRVTPRLLPLKTTSWLGKQSISWTRDWPGASQPFKVYHGKTGVIYNVTQRAVGVILYKQVGNRYIEKRINVRIEHVRSSRSREEFLRRVKSNAEKRRKAKEDGTQVSLKRKPAMPRDARTVSAKDNKPESITPIAYETTI